MNADQLLANGNRLGAEASKQTGIPFTPTTITPSVKTGQPLDASMLGATTPLKVPEAQAQSTVSSGIGGMASSIAETTGKALTDSVNADKVAKEQELKSSKNALQSVFDQYLSTSGSRQAEEEKAQIAQKAQATSDARAEAQTASNNIIASQRAQENELKALQNIGLTDVQKGQRTQEISRQYAREQADLSLISLVANSKLNNANFDLATAQSIVDKKIENQLEPLRLQMDFAKTFYQENRDAFSKSEDRAFQAKADEAKRAFDTEKENLDRIASLQLEAAKNGAPSSVIRAIGSAKTFDEAISKTGGYASDPLDRKFKQAQLDNLYSQITERNNSDGGVQTITGKPQNASQASANGYADRVAEADVIISTLGGDFTGSLAIGGKLPNVLQGGDRQAYEQAKRNFVNAVLRRESGAAISPTEFDSAQKQYFPQAGDKADVVAQKENSRNTAINNLYREANVARPVLPGQIIESGGKKYRVESDGETLTEL